MTSPWSSSSTTTAPIAAGWHLPWHRSSATIRACASSTSPILGPGSTFAARAALAAQAQGKYAPFHEALMEAQETLDERRILEIARSIGLDLEQLREGMRDPAIDRAIERNLQLAAALGITGTPSFVIGDEIVPGAVDRGTLEGSDRRRAAERVMPTGRGRATERGP